MGQAAGCRLRSGGETRPPACRLQCSAARSALHPRALTARALHTRAPQLLEASGRPSLVERALALSRRTQPPPATSGPQQSGGAQLQSASSIHRASNTAVPTPPEPAGGVGSFAQAWQDALRDLAAAGNSSNSSIAAELGSMESWQRLAALAGGAVAQLARVQIALQQPAAGPVGGA